MTETGEHYDVVIIGGGPAGLTAAIYSARKGLKTLVIERGLPSGRMNDAPFIENYPGFPDGIKGSELANLFAKQAEKFGVEIHQMEEVADLDLKSDPKVIVTRKEKYLASAVIIAIGAERKKLLIPEEKEFLGRGVSYCATCDGFFFKNRVVAVIGSGDEAAEDALLLANLASKVYLITNAKNLECEEVLKEKIRETGKIEVINNYKVTKIVGDEVVKAVELKNIDTGEGKEIEVNGVFLALGAVPMTEIMRKSGIETHDRGCIIVDNLQKTNIEGVYAAGDCTCNSLFQVVTAAGQGARAATSAYSYIRVLKKAKMQK